MMCLLNNTIFRVTSQLLLDKKIDYKSVTSLGEAGTREALRLAHQRAWYPFTHTDVPTWRKPLNVGVKNYKIAKKPLSALVHLIHQKS